MDIFALKAYWKYKDYEALKALIPAGLLGVIIAWSLAAYVTADILKLIIGINAIAYVIYTYFSKAMEKQAKPHLKRDGWVWGGLSGFTSTLAHAGALPMSLYLLPRKLPPFLMVAITTKFIAVINFAKIIPYFSLGQFSSQNLGLSLLFLPIALIGVLTGYWLLKRISQDIFYKIIYITLLIMGIKLTYDGVISLI